MSEKLPVKSRPAEVSVLPIGSTRAVGRHSTCNNDLGLGKNFANAQAWSMTAAHWSTTVTAPHYISENKSDMRGIKSGWYAIEDDGNLSSGPFSSREQCVNRITQPTNGDDGVQVATRAVLKHSSSPDIWH